MNCPTCGGPITDGDAFCGNCGTPIAAAQPTQPMQPPPAQPVAQQPTQVMPTAVQPTQPVQAAQQQYGYQQTAPVAPAPGKKTGLIVALTIIGVLVVIGILAGGFFAYRAFTADDSDTPTATETSTPSTAEEPTPSDATPVGAATAEDALAAELPADWVFTVDSDSGDVIEYLIGPPNSEYVEVVVVAQQPDGSWLIEDSYALEGDMAGDGAMTPEEEAIQVVGEFIYAVQEDRPDDAHTLTISPFAEDPASAMYSNGDLSSFELTDAQLQSDGSTVWVWSSENWTWGNESYIYICVPTVDGYRITDLRIP